jgi:hypothetical protein
MGVVYRARCGIGYQVDSDIGNIEVWVESASDMLPCRDLYENMVEYLDSELCGGFYHAETGEWAYTGVHNKVYVFISLPVNENTDLAISKALLDAEMERLGLDEVGVFGFHCGIEVY